MGTIHVAAERAIEAPPDVVYNYLAGVREHHVNFLPPAFSDVVVESGGVGAGTVVAFTITAGGRSRSYRMVVAEPEPGRVLTESDMGSSLVITYTVTPQGAGSKVAITTTWQGATGIGGFFERTFAPKAMKTIYDDALSRLDAYAREKSRIGDDA
jgi:hypothetical protein